MSDIYRLLRLSMPNVQCRMPENSDFVRHLSFGIWHFAIGCLPADSSQRPRGLLADSCVGILQALRKRGDRAVVADRAQRPGGLLAHTGGRLAQGADQPVDGAPIADRAERPAPLLAH